jgi:hypothetical protein
LLISVTRKDKYQLYNQEKPRSILQNRKKRGRKKASSEKLDQTLSYKRKVRRTLPLGNSQKE